MNGECQPEYQEQRLSKKTDNELIWSAFFIYKLCPGSNCKEVLLDQDMII